MTTRKLRIGALASGGGTNLQAIIDACERNLIDGEVVFVGADVPRAGALDRARRHRIPVFEVDYAQVFNSLKRDRARMLPADFQASAILARTHLLPPDLSRSKKTEFIEKRVAAESQLLKQMAPYPFDLIVLAGFMRTLSPYFIDKINTDADCPRIMNIHPALLPAFPGTDGYGDTFRYGCKIGGCTVHFIDYGEDTGPIIGQRAFAIDPADSLEDVKQKGLALEWQLYPECIQLFAENRLELKTLENDRKIIEIIDKSK